MSDTIFQHISINFFLILAEKWASFLATHLYSMESVLVNTGSAKEIPIVIRVFAYNTVLRLVEIALFSSLYEAVFFAISATRRR